MLACNNHSRFLASQSKSRRPNQEATCVKKKRTVVVRVDGSAREAMTIRTQTKSNKEASIRWLLEA